MGSKAVRDRKNRRDKTIRGTDVVGGIRVDAHQHCTGRTEVMTKTLIPTNARQAAFVFGDN